MTAMPPTKGHLRLIQFAARLTEARGGDRVTVIINTQPGEPAVAGRVGALAQAARKVPGNSIYAPEVVVHNIHRSLPQEPSGHEGFWDMWQGFLVDHGLVKGSGDVIVASEMYGKRLAAECSVDFFPYDIDRSLLWTKATDVRRETRAHFADILPEFQPYLRKTVTLFGAESTGKTTLSKALARDLNGHWTFEYARPYLETVGIEINEEAMRDIWHGQMGLQMHARADMVDKPFIIQDTDLYSTVGYWDHPDNWAMWDLDGASPSGLVLDAQDLRSDLYLITQSNIPFEKDPIRYGGDVRQSNDQYWIDLCEKFELNYHVLQGETINERRAEARTVCEELFDNSPQVVSLGAYVREGQ